MPLDDVFVEMTPGVDPHAFGLTRQEAFVLTRALLGRQTLDALVRLTGLPADEALTVIRALIAKGVLRQEGGPAPASVAPALAPAMPVAAAAPPTAPPTAPPRVPAGGEGSTRPEGVSGARAAFPPGFALAQDAMAESCDLSTEQKTRILLLDWLREHRTHYALLDVAIDAPSADIKKSFFRVSREFHPDAFFRKSLGSFKVRLERVFRASKLAHEVLSDPVRRATYDEGLRQEHCSPDEWRVLSERAAERRAAEEAERARLARDERVAERLRAQRLARNPMLQRAQKAREWMALAEQAVAEGKLEQALRHATLAKEYAPADRALVVRADAIAALLGQKQASLLLRRAKSLLERQEGAEVPGLIEDALARAPRDATVLVEAGRLFLACGRQQAALRVAEQAAAEAPTDANAWRLLAELAEAERKWALALPAAEKLLELLPDDKDANVRLKRIRKAAR